MDSSKYIDLLTDYGFKRVFGNKELLMGFLNALFERDGKVIKAITYINKEMTPVSKDDRTIYYDVLCKVEGQDDIIIEMQQKSQETFRDRAIFYMSRAFDRQGTGKKNWKYKMHAVYGIFITNFHLREVNLPEQAVSEYVIKNKETNEIFTDKFRMFFIDLLTFNKKTEDELVTDLDKWIYSIKNMGTMTTAPRMASRGVFQRLYSESELAAMTARERNLYERSLHHHWDMLADKETTRNRIKAARAEGEQQKAASIAKNLKSIGIPAEQIAAVTGLSIAQIESII